MKIYARINPKDIKLTEIYRYEKFISSNESLDQKEAPQGKIEVIIPYDGHTYFNTKSVQDIAQQINNNASGETVEAVIGHLAMSNYSKTDLENLLTQNHQQQSVPLIVPVAKNILTGAKQLEEDKHLCVIKHNYRPTSPEFNPIYPEILILDDYNFLLDDYDYLTTSFSKTANNFFNSLPRNYDLNKIADKIAERVKHGFGSDSDLAKGKLFIFIKVQIKLDLSSLELPDNFKLPQIPRIKKVSIEWPTLTSFQSFDIKIIGEKNNLNIFYNPINKSLEWTDISNGFEKDILMTDLNQPNRKNSNTQWQNYEIQMLLGILQPGELYQQTNLKGEIEVEIPDFLLSGLQVRFYGFNDNKVGAVSQDKTQLKTRIITDFDVDINQAFKKRMRSTSQELVFDNILPDDDKIRNVENILRSQGFLNNSIKLMETQNQNSNELNSQTSILQKKWLIYAERSEGIDKIGLWIVVAGEEKTTLVTINQGKRKFQQIEKNGKLTMYLLGKLPRDSHLLMQRINALQKELRKQLVQQGAANRISE